MPISSPLTRDFLRAMAADGGVLAPAHVARVRPQVRTGDSIPPATDMILFGTMIVVVETEILSESLSALRANRIAIEIAIRAATNEFGPIDDPDPIRRRNLRYNGMFLERRPPPGGAAMLRITFSGKSGRLIGNTGSSGPGGGGVPPDQGVMSPDVVPTNVTRVGEVLEYATREAAIPATGIGGYWAPTIALRGALDVILDPSFGYAKGQPRENLPPKRAFALLPFDPYVPLDPRTPA